MRYPAFLVCLLLTLTHALSAEEEVGRVHAAAPKNHSIIRNGYGGAWYIPNELWKMYSELKAQAEKLNDEIDRGEPDAALTIQEIERLKKELAALDSLIEDEKVFVSPMKLYEQTDTYEFELSPTRAVIIVADDVHLESWDGPGIRCVMKKSILGQEPPTPDEFAQILIEHELRVANDLVGTTADERAASNRKFLNSPAGKSLTEEQRVHRQAGFDDNTRYRLRYADYQGKPANVLKIKGLKFDEGNRNITVEVHSEGGTGNMSIHWKRKADVVVYLPKQVRAAVFGAQAGIQVKNFSGDLLLSNSHSTFRDYNGEFMIEGLEGTLSIYGVPIRTVRNIRGSVVVENEAEMRNGGTHHGGGLRHMYVDTSLSTKIENVTKDVTGTWIHTKLTVSGVQGNLNLVNNFGTTEVVLPAQIVEGTHRVLSESGSIHIRTTNAALTAFPWYVFNQVGEIQVDVDREVLDEIQFSTEFQSWSGLLTATGRDDLSSTFSRFERPQQIRDNSKRSNGFDVLSRAGRIVIESD